MPDRPTANRVLIYSHDTFGLGHLRRCRAIAHALVERRRNVSVLILSGSPIVGSFDFNARVDFVRIPGVTKRRDGEYSALNLDMGVDEVLGLRAALIRHTAEAFRPDLFIVDKEPLGLRGEVADTLAILKGRGVPLVLGLRDVLDEPALLAPEWQRKNVLPALKTLYDELWVYGPPGLCDPLEGVAVPPSVRRKMRYTGYLRREAPAATEANANGADAPGHPYILVTPGGGGDGEALVDWVLRAYESDPGIPWRAVVVLGPFMHPDRRAAFLARAGALPQVTATVFEPRLESLMRASAGVVAMGGYNTFCEILSFDRPALIVPREVPRREQFIRAARATELGLASMLVDDGERRAADMAAALRRLPHQAPPSSVPLPGLLDGLDAVDRLAGRHLARPAAPVPRLHPHPAAELAYG
ncbi:MAG TPA: glycosyltransferase [Azospirillum sp.]|nr:glycosyltransferase [Azospirillum sp.]